MSHFAVLVLSPTGSDEEVTSLLAPYDENDEWFADGSRWDWWVIGGRWTGLLSGGEYKPTEDPLNYERCDLCDGTGERPGAREQFGDDWHEWCHGCNGCMGKGERLKHAPDWRECDSDRKLVADIDLREINLPLAVVTPDGKWYEQARSGWFGARIEDEAGSGEKPEALWAATVRALFEQFPGATAVVVDCHV